MPKMLGSSWASAYFGESDQSALSTRARRESLQTLWVHSGYSDMTFWSHRFGFEMRLVLRFEYTEEVARGYRLECLIKS